MKNLSLIAPYSITVSVLYLLGYWGVYGINIFEYASLTDILKVSIYQLAYYGSFLVVSAFIFHFYTGSVLKPGSGSDTPTGEFLNKYKKIVFTIFIFLALYLALFTSYPSRWFISTAILSPFVGVFASRVTILDGVISNHSFRTMIITVIIQIPLFAFGWGNVTGVSAKTDLNKTVLINESETYQNIGVAGAYIFLWSGDKSELLIKPLSYVKEIKYTLPKEESFYEKLTKSPASNKPSNADSDKAAAGS